MSNNSWKQYGGIGNLDKFNTINVSTVIANQFISRSVNPTYQFLNGTIEVSTDFIAGKYVTAANSIFTNENVIIKQDIYANNKLFFGDNQFIVDKDTFVAFDNNSTHAYIYGDASNIGINTMIPKTVFNVTGTIESVTDILTIESGNAYIRNIIAQNKNQRGIVVDANDNSSTIRFYNDVSTNQTNTPNAIIQYQTGGILTTSTSERVVTISNTAQFDTSGGVLLMDASGTFLTTIGEISLQTDRGYLLNTSGGRILLDDVIGNMYLDTSNLFILTCSGGIFQSNQFIVDTSRGDIVVNSGDTKLNTFLKISPPERGISNELLYDETVSIYDNSNQQFLPNVYNDPSIFTGNATTFIGKDSKSNTFIHMNPATNKLGSAIGGGMAPYDSTRAMSMVGLTDTNGKYIPSQMTVSSSNTHKYLSTMGINTYAPLSEDYVLDVNGAIHIGNGEINTIIDATYEITYMHFSRTSTSYGIAVGSPSTRNGTDIIGVPNNNYKQFLLYTHDGGKYWTKSDILQLTSTSEESPITFQHVHVFDSSYSIVTSSGYIFITFSGGITWKRLEPQDSGVSITSGIHTSTIIELNAGTFRIIITYNDKIRYVDVSLSNSDNVLRPTMFGGQTSILTIQTASDIVDNQIYFTASGGLIRYNVSNNSYNIINNNSYNSVFVYDSSRVIAVGNNIISYTVNTTDWTNISNNQTNINLSNITLQSVFVQDVSNAIVVGSSGEFIYSTEWQTGVWQMIPDNIINTSGMKDRIRGAENNLKSIYMPDINTFIIADVLTTFEYVTPETDSNNELVLDVSSQLGYSKIQYVFLPNLFNRTNNNIIDVSGNMVITGDIEVFEGELLVNTIDCEPHTTYLSGTLDIGTKTHVVNIGKTDNLNDINLSQSFNNYSSVVNIGAIIPNELNKNLINIGNYSGLSNYSNRINIGGGKDMVVISGDVRYTNTTISRSKNKGFQINDFNLHEGIVLYLTDKKGVNFDNIVTDASYQAVLTVLAGDSVINDISYNGQTSEYELDVINYVDVSYNDVLGWITTIRSGVSSSLIEYLIQDYTTNPFNSGAGAGIFVTDNFDRNAGYLKVSQDMNGWVMKPTLIDSKTLKIDVNNLILRNTSYNSTTDVSGIHDIHNGIVVLTRSEGGTNGDSDYILGVKQFDISNILVRDSLASSNLLQVVNTKLHVMDDVSMNNTLYVKENVTFDSDLFVKGDASFNENVFVGGDVSFNGDVDISGVLRATYMQNNYVINTVTSDYEFIVTTDMSLNGTLQVEGRVGIGTNNPQAKLDVSGNVRFIGDVSMNGNVKIENNNTFTVGTGASLMGGNLGVGGTLDVSYAVVLHTTLRVDGNTTLGDNLSLNSDSAVLSIGLDDDFKITHDGSSGAIIHATPLTITSAGDSTYSTTAGVLSLTGASGVNISGGIISVNSSGITDIDSVSTLSINSLSGAINIGNDTDTGEINIGSGNSARTIQVGNILSTALNANAKAITITSVDALTLTDGQAILTLSGEGATTLDATTISIDATDHSNVSVTGEGKNLTIAAIGGGTQRLNIISAGTGTDAITIDASAGGITINGNVDISGNLYATYPNNSIPKSAISGLGVTIDLSTNSSFVNTRFYPIVLIRNDLNPIHFKITGDSLNTSNPYNENTLVGYARGSGNSGHPIMYDVHINKTTASENRFFAIMGGGTSSSFNGGIVIYMRGDYKYYIDSDADTITIPAPGSELTDGIAINNARFPVINDAGTPVGLSSANTLELLSLTSTSGTQRRYISGDLKSTGQIEATSFNAVSDIRHKENIEDLETALTKINSIRGVNFNFINDTTKRLHSGVIAQEVDPHMPELINKSDSDQWSVNYDGFIPYLIESVKTLTIENESLTQKVASLESKIEFIMQNLHP